MKTEPVLIAGSWREFREIDNTFAAVIPMTKHHCRDVSRSGWTRGGGGVIAGSAALMRCGGCRRENWARALAGRR